MANSATQFEPVDRAVVSLGAGEALFGAQAANFDWQTKSLVGGTGVSLSSDANAITITATGDSPNNKVDATAAPTVNDDSAGTAGSAGTDGTNVYTVGSFWIDVTNDNAYRLVDDSVGAAVWVQTNQTASATNLGYTAAPAQGTVTSSTGTDAVVPVVDATNAGLMIPADKAKSDFITITQAVDLDALEQDVADLTTLTGLASNSTTFGTFTNLTDNTTLNTLLGDIDTALTPENLQDAVLVNTANGVTYDDAQNRVELGGALDQATVINVDDTNTLSLVSTDTTATAGDASTIFGFDNGTATGTRGFYMVNGTPEANLAASPGALAVDYNGGAAATLYVKETGTGNTGWSAVGAGGAGISALTLAGDTGTQAIGDTDTITVAGGDGVVTTVAATDTATVDLDLNELAEVTAINDGDLFAISRGAGTNRNISLLNLQNHTGKVLSGTIASGATTVAVAHGLGSDPGIANVRGITLTNFSLVQKVRAVSTDATNVNFEVMRDPGTNGQSFNFEVSL